MSINAAVLYAERVNPLGVSVGAITYQKRTLYTAITVDGLANQCGGLKKYQVRVRLK